MSRYVAIIAAAAVFALSACTEKPQVLGSNPNDQQPWAGSKYPYAAPGWKAGDKTSWQDELRVRTERGQNEYNRM